MKNYPAYKEVLTFHLLRLEIPAGYNLRKKVLIVSRKPGLQVIRKNFMLNSTEYEIYPPPKC